MKRKILLVIVCLLVSFSCGTAEEVGNDLPKSEPFTYTGSGTDVTEYFKCEGEVVFFGASYSGSGNFIVHLVRVGSGEVEAYLFNEIGSYTGTVSDNPSVGDYFLEVEASGEWEIAITGSVTYSNVI